MEQLEIKQIGIELESLRAIMENIQSYLMEDELEISDEVVKEIEESRKRPESEFISLEDIEQEFNDN